MFNEILLKAPSIQLSPAAFGEVLNYCFSAGAFWGAGRYRSARAQLFKADLFASLPAGVARERWSGAGRWRGAGANRR